MGQAKYNVPALCENYNGSVLMFPTCTSVKRGVTKLMKLIEARALHSLGQKK